MAKAALALPYSGLSGSLGDTTIVQRPDGPVVRQRVYRPRTLSPAQAASAERMRRVSRAWTELDDATYEAWKRYAPTQAWRNAATGAIVVPKPSNLFCALAGKARQVDPTVSLAGFMPPERVFTGDAVEVECGVSIVDCGEEPSTIHNPQSTMLLFSADRANAPGVVTELLAQPLANARRKAYPDKYVSRGFVAFAGAASVEVPLAPGAYACAVRFVRAATGQETALVELGVAVVRPIKVASETKVSTMGT